MQRVYDDARPVPRADRQAPRRHGARRCSRARSATPPTARNSPIPSGTLRPRAPRAHRRPGGEPDVPGRDQRARSRRRHDRARDRHRRGVDRVRDRHAAAGAGSTSPTRPESCARQNATSTAIHRLTARSTTSPPTSARSSNGRSARAPRRPSATRSRSPVPPPRWRRSRRQLVPYDPDEGPGIRAHRRRRSSLQAARLDPLEQRSKHPGLDPARAPTIVAGAVILSEVMALFGLEQVEVSEHDILRGAALEL